MGIRFLATGRGRRRRRNTLIIAPLCIEKIALGSMSGLLVLVWSTSESSGEKCDSVSYARYVLWFKETTVKCLVGNGSLHVKFRYSRALSNNG